jgi:hypothetical protein
MDAPTERPLARGDGALCGWEGAASADEVLSPGASVPQRVRACHVDGSGQLRAGGDRGGLRFGYEVPCRTSLVLAGAEYFLGDAHTRGGRRALGIYSAFLLMCVAAVLWALCVDSTLLAAILGAVARGTFFARLASRCVWGDLRPLRLDRAPVSRAGVTSGGAATGRRLYAATTA